jgi:hypothetical protein
MKISRLVRKYLDFGAEPSNVRLMVTFLTLWLAGQCIFYVSMPLHLKC